jgi:hypothetical protein
MIALESHVAPAATPLLAFAPGQEGLGLDLDRLITSRMRLPKAQERILRVLINHHPRALDRETLAGRAEQSPRSSAFGNHLSELREAGLIDYPQAGQVVATALLFPTFKEHR